MTMTKSTFSRIAASVLFATTLSLGACKQGEKPEDALASDPPLAHDLQLANADTMSQPELKDVPATVAPGPPPTAPEAKVSRRQTPSDSLTPRRNPRPVATTPRSNPEPIYTAPATTANGNTVSENAPGASNEHSVGTIASGSEIALYSGQRVCTNQYQGGGWVTAVGGECGRAGSG